LVQSPLLSFFHHSNQSRKLVQLVSLYLLNGCLEVKQRGLYSPNITCLGHLQIRETAASHFRPPHLFSHSHHRFHIMRVTIPGKGSLQGSTLLDSASRIPKCHRFSAVPYALPPTGSRRWRKPEPLPPTFSYGPKDYIRRSSVCPQLRVFGTQSVSHDEDCLQSNIYVPIGKPPPNGWPVIFYIREFPVNGDTQC